MEKPGVRKSGMGTAAACSWRMLHAQLGGGQPPALGAGGVEDRLGPWRVRGALAEDRARRTVPLEGS